MKKHAVSSDFIEKLRHAVGDSGIFTNTHDMAPYLTDWRDRKTGTAQCVILPESTKQVVEVVRLAADAGCPIFPQGGNTGLCYGAVPSDEGDGIVLGLRRMNRVREINKVDNAIIVDAGVVLSTIHDATKQIDRTFPLHLGSEGTAQIGGLVSTNAGGTNALRYGTARDLVYGLEVVLANGAVLDDLSPLRKNNTGYDLKHLFIGGEGTLGIITATSLKLHPAIRSEAHCWVAAPTLDAATKLLRALQDQFDTAVLACELLCRKQVELVLRHIPRTRAPVSRIPEWSVLIELGCADAEEDLKAKLEFFIMKMIDSNAIEDAVVAQNLSQSADFWRLRHSVSEANKLAGRGLTHDISVRISSLPSFVADCATLVRDRFPTGYPVVTCHLGDGNVHYIVMFPNESWNHSEDSTAVEEEVQTAIHDIAMAHRGSFSAEHGIGRKLTKELKRLTGRNRYDSLLKVKNAFDPDSILNPGIAFDQLVPVLEP